MKGSSPQLTPPVGSWSLQLSCLISSQIHIADVAPTPRPIHLVLD